MSRLIACFLSILSCAVLECYAPATVKGVTVTSCENLTKFLETQRKQQRMLNRGVEEVREILDTTQRRRNDPESRECLHCGGDGKILCARCYGEGEITSINSDPRECLDCLGKGRRTCNQCCGIGRR